MWNHRHVALLWFLGGGNGNLQVVPRLKMLRWIFFFIFIIIKFSYCCYTFIYDDICLCRKTDIILLGRPLHLVKMRIETGRYHSSNTRAF